MANTRETIGDAACLDALTSDSLTAFEDDGVTAVAKKALQRKATLESLKLDNCASIGLSGLAYCSNLLTIDMKGGASFASLALASCSELRQLVMRATSKTSIETSSLDGCDALKREGAVYVSQSLVSAYKADNKWKPYIILPLEDYPKSGLPETVSDSWSQIAAASLDGTYDGKYSVGDIKSIAIDGDTYYMQLVAKDADPLASDVTSTAHMTWVLYRTAYATKHRMAPANSSGQDGTGANGGWASSEMRSWLASTVLPLLPSEVTAAIKTVRKYTDIVEPGQTSVTHNDETDDDLWIPSAGEVSYGGGYTYETLGPVYSDAYFSNITRTKYDTASGNAAYWWSRSASSNTNYRTISGTGSYGSANASFQNCVIFGFCI